jgi:hypothetical protein
MNIFKYTTALLIIVFLGWIWYGVYLLHTGDTQIHIDLDSPN